jgi:hypothetical protein
VPSVFATLVVAAAMSAVEFGRSNGLLRRSLITKHTRYSPLHENMLNFGPFQRPRQVPRQSWQNEVVQQ